MVASTKRRTIEDLERDGMPEGRWELIDGELVEMPGSGALSSRVGALFVNALLNHVHPRRLGVVLGADGGFVLFPGRELLRVADAAFVAADRLPDPGFEGFYRLAPDLVVEVISPFDRQSEVAAKVTMWLEAGVRLVWVADPRPRTIAISRADGSTDLLHDGDTLTGGDVLPEFRAAVSDLLG
jgi:Uma2 family endonuclease